MFFLNAFIIVILLSILIIPFSGSTWKGIMAIVTVILLSVISSIPAIHALSGNNTNLLLNGSEVTGNVFVTIDALSAWFILIINFTFITGVIYGSNYMQAYKSQKSNLTLHWISFIFVHASLISICSLQNAIMFLILWEIMALSAFLLVIFEHNKQQILKAGINYLIQSHVSIITLFIAFLWVLFKTNSFDFSAIREFSINSPVYSSIILMILFFIGFGIKAGFVPFHTWLPHAHPAAPSHISGVMSGVIIKIGIYGILRMLILIDTDFLFIGYFILAISIISGLYGVMLAILQHNLKKLLAYHSIENIGIIGIGIGLGCIGIGNGNSLLSVLGFSGALLHTLNHSLFKSLLFYGAGNVYQSAHTINIEQLGGFGKKMPHTALLFLIAALAICGLPPFNGFISEYLIYNGLFTGLKGDNSAYLLFIIFSVLALVLIGGLAILCFTKAFGTIFLGTPRRHLSDTPHESNVIKLIPMYLVLVLILTIGLFPQLFFSLLKNPVNLLTGTLDNNPLVNSSIVKTLTGIGYSSMAFILFSGTIFFIRKRLVSNKLLKTGSTWGCGYVGPSQKMQYTASSFIRMYRKLAEPLFSIHKFKKEIKGVFPDKGWHETHPKDKIEESLIKNPLRQFRHFLNRFAFLQSGNPQVYILYGVVFIIMIIGIPVIFNFIHTLIDFFNSL